MSADDNVGLDHYRRERSRQLRAVDGQIALPLETIESSHASLARSNSSPNLHDMFREQVNAPRVSPIVKVKSSASFSPPHDQKKISIQPQHCPATEVDPVVPPVPPINLTFDKCPAFVRHLQKLNFVIPGRLAYVSTTKAEVSNMQADARCLNVSVISSHLHRQYVSLCADFGPVALNCVHRFCQVPAICDLFLTIRHKVRKTSTCRPWPSESPRPSAQTTWSFTAWS
jgi:hypothetical protein